MTILVTGATSGIGLATAMLLAQQGNRVSIVGRTGASVELAAERIRRVASADVSSYVADLAEADQVHALTEAVRAEVPTLDGLVLCAGVVHPVHRLTDGVDTTLAVNHLAAVRLVGALDDHLARGRIVLIASSQHGSAGPFDPAVFAPDAPSSATRRYEATKLLNLLYATQRLRHPHRAPLEVVDPGFVHTRLGRNSPIGFRLMLTLTRPFQVDPRVPARLIADRLVADDFQDGAYRSLKGVARSASNARDRDAAERAWAWTTTQLADDRAP